MDNRQGGERKTEAHAPFCPHPTCGPSASRVCSLAEGPGAQPHCEAGPACWPRPGPLLLHSDSDSQTRGSCTPSRAFPATCGWSGPGVVAGGGCALLLQTQRLCIWQPTPQHAAARSGFVDKSKVWNGFLVSVSLSLHQRDKPLHSPFVRMPASAFALFLTFWSPGNFSYGDSVF